ncbi:hypothetical protein GUJ93_ZPchr0005g14964 [Zizania palustris]|uniref:AB hydrolase-1 domain-containing protein n=1 Tax=Zizania palustris TaxID=103762 RepID=A0A8J5SW25_ZIZPA|nr:hypothetical protein GUJ93_ZPchr0005g14964 [Zizania palustris]
MELTGGEDNGGGGRGTTSCWCTGCATARGAGTRRPRRSGARGTAPRRSTWPAAARTRRAWARCAPSRSTRARCGRAGRAAARERVVLVAHSNGGFSAALAAERLPERLAAVVFLTASPRRRPPHGRHHRGVSGVRWGRVLLDSRQLEQENPEIPGNPEIFGPNFMARMLYQLSPPEDLTLALSLVRPVTGSPATRP